MTWDLDHRQIGYVAAICREGSLGRAASRLGVSQPTLSKLIARLEDRLGLTLFDRDGRGMVPTIFAQHLARRAGQVDEVFASLHSDLRAMALGESGVVRIGLGPGMSHIFRLAMVGPLLARFSRLQLDITAASLDELYDGLRRGAFEFLLANPAGIRPGDDFVEVPVLTDSLAFYGAHDHPLSRKAEVGGPELLAYPCAFPYHPPDIMRLLPTKRTPEQEANLFAHRSSDLLLIREIVRSTDAVSYTLRALLEPDVQAGMASEIKLRGTWPFGSSMVATRAAWHSPVIRQAASIFRDACRAWLSGASPAPTA